MNFSKYKSIIFWAGILLAQSFFFSYLIRIPKIQSLLEDYFFWKSAWQIKILCKIPISLGDVLYILALILLALWIGLFVKSKSKIKFLSTLLVVINLCYFIYQISWGNLYTRQPISKKLPENNGGAAEILNLTNIYIAKALHTRENITKDLEGNFVIKDQSKIIESITEQSDKIPFVSDKVKLIRYNNIKPSLFSKLLNYTGILGYYNPFTSEAQYNPNLPPSQLPFTLAHEHAHQLGIAREQEASFIGFLIGEQTTNPDVKYSTQLFALKNLLRELSKSNRADYENVYKAIPQEILHDFEQDRIFYEKYKGPISSFFSTTNDLFLKSNKQDGSITYSYFTSLLLQYEHHLK